MVFSTQAEKTRWLNLKRQELKEQGFSEDEIEEQIEALAEVNWTQNEWNDYYGGYQEDW